MNLRQLAESDLSVILEDNTTGFGWPITITNPSGLSNLNPLYGYSKDVAQTIDPNTGEIISGRTASVALRISTLEAEGLGIPYGVADSSIKPWVVAFEDINGNAHVFKVRHSYPDRTLGMLTCTLELYEQ